MNSQSELNGKVRMRRAKSVAVVETSEKEYRARAEQPDNPCHKPRDSLLSSSSGYTNYRGVLNLCIVLLHSMKWDAFRHAPHTFFQLWLQMALQRFYKFQVLSNARVALENIIKYGILVDPVQWLKVFVGRPTRSPSALIVLGLGISPLISLGIEKILSKGHLSEKVGLVLTTVMVTAVVTIPPICVYTLDCHAVAASVVLGFVSIVFLKLVSYHMVNYWCRENRAATSLYRRRSASAERSRTGKSCAKIVDERANKLAHFSIGPEGANGDISGTIVTYPNNLNIKDIYYFILAPTLCYELNFPRSTRVRKRFLIKRIVEMLFLLQLILGLIQQWIVPTINNSLKPLQEMNYSRMLERLLKLAVPNHLLWLMFFYWYFHSVLNTVAEILRFADRHFYNDWWNAETVHYFWQNWNVPVHRWCVRHLYKPLLRSGFTKSQASMTVFFVSAFFHEYLVSVPLKMFRVWAFLGMLGQIPFASFVNRFLHNQYGNMAVWLSLIIGQPLCILMYYHDYYVIHTQNVEAMA